MAFDFPASPTVNQVYTPAGGPSYIWNGVAWKTALMGIPDAPSDGNDYVRRNGAWVAVRLTSKLTATSDQIVIDNLEPDTLYRGSILMVPGTVDATIYWQTRFVAGGAWDQAASSYSRMSVSGYGATVVASSVTEGSSLIQGLDTGTPSRPAHVRCQFYSGAAGRWPSMSLTTGGLSADATLLSVNINYADRRASGAATSIRLISDIAGGLGAGSRFSLERVS